MKKFFNSRWFTLCLMLTGAAFVTFGIFRGEIGTVLMKATNICMECIGIG